MSLSQRARPAVLIAHTRSGGTFLAHCLSTHPDIFCPRGEPLMGEHSWRQALPRVPAKTILHGILHAFHYQVGMCRLTFVQADLATLTYLREIKAQIVFLQRENLLRCAVSQVIMNMVRRGATKHVIHTTGPVKAPYVTLCVPVVLERMRWQKEWQARMLTDVTDSGLRVLWLTYKDIVGGERVNAERLTLLATERICSFLGVVQYPLSAPLRAVSPHYLSAIVRNWGELEAAVKDTEFAHFLAEEE